MARNRSLSPEKAASKNRLKHKAGIALLRLVPRGKEVLLLKKKRGRWSLPKGLCRPGEPVKDTCLRECREETGYNPTRVFFVSSGMNFRKTVLLYLWKSNVSSPYPGRNGSRGHRKEIRRLAWFNAVEARRVLKSWQWDLLAKVFR